MELEPLKTYVDRGLSLSQLSEKLGMSDGSIRHWMAKYELTLYRGPKGKLPGHRCGKCGVEGEDNFYSSKAGTCKTCHNKYVTEWSRKLKARVVAYLGGGCKVCGYATYDCSLDIHHKDPAEKDPNFHMYKSWSWKRIEAELQKCILLCRNCHAAVHVGHITIGV